MAVEGCPRMEPTAHCCCRRLPMVAYTLFSYIYIYMYVQCGRRAHGCGTKFCPLLLSRLSQDEFSPNVLTVYPTDTRHEALLPGPHSIPTNNTTHIGHTHTIRYSTTASSNLYRRGWSVLPGMKRVFAVKNVGGSE